MNIISSYCALVGVGGAKSCKRVEHKRSFAEWRVDARNMRILRTTVNLLCNPRGGFTNLEHEKRLIHSCLRRAPYFLKDNSQYLVRSMNDWKSMKSRLFRRKKKNNKKASRSDPEEKTLKKDLAERKPQEKTY